MRIEPSDSYLYISLGQVLVQQGRIDEAQEVYLYRLKELEFLDEHTRNTDSGLSLELPLALGETYRRKRQFEEARKWFKQTVEWSKSYETSWASPEVYAIQGWLRITKTHAQEGNQELAREALANAEDIFETATVQSGASQFYFEGQYFLEQKNAALSPD